MNKSSSIKRLVPAYALAIIILLTSFIIALKFGAVELSFSEIFAALAEGPDSTDYTVFYKVRMPRVVLAGVIGGGLAIVGAAMQSIFQNPLVDSYTLGMSSGASLGAVIAISTGATAILPGISGLSVFAFLGAVLTLALVYGLASTRGRVSTNSLLLSGIVVSYFISSLISIIMLLSKDGIDQMVFWNMGSLSAASWSKASTAMIIIIPCSFVLYYFYRELNMMSFGEESASYLGVNTKKAKLIMLGASALIVGTVVAIGGTIGFVGLIAPHIARYFVGAENKKVLLMSVIMGSTTLMLADTLGRVLIRPSEIPVGVMTSVIAGPIFIYLLRKNRRK